MQRGFTYLELFKGFFFFFLVWFVQQNKNLTYSRSKKLKSCTSILSVTKNKIVVNGYILLDLPRKKYLFASINISYWMVSITKWPWPCTAFIFKVRKSPQTSFFRVMLVQKHWWVLNNIWILFRTDISFSSAFS